MRYAVSGDCCYRRTLFVVVGRLIPGLGPDLPVLRRRLYRQRTRRAPAAAITGPHKGTRSGAGKRETAIEFDALLSTLWLGSECASLSAVITGRGYQETSAGARPARCSVYKRHGVAIARSLLPFNTHISPIDNCHPIPVSLFYEQEQVKAVTQGDDTTNRTVLDQRESLYEHIEYR